MNPLKNIMRYEKQIEKLWKSFNIKFSKKK